MLKKINSDRSNLNKTAELKTHFDKIFTRIVNIPVSVSKKITHHEN